MSKILNWENYLKEAHRIAKTGIAIGNSKIFGKHSRFRRSSAFSISDAGFCGSKKFVKKFAKKLTLRNQ